MIGKLDAVRRFLALFLLLPLSLAAPPSAAVCSAMGSASAQTDNLTAAQANALVERALASELRAAQDTSHPMRFRLHKVSPHLTSTKEIIETRDGAVARLVARFDRPLNAADEQEEQARLDALLADPSRQVHRKHGEDDDMNILLKLLRMLPKAFVYQYAGVGVGPAGPVQKFTFRPNRAFNPPDLETQALTALTGQLWIDAAQERVTRLEGHLQQDTDYGWGILGKLNKGGWVLLEQADVGGQQWRIARFQMVMDLRILFKNKSFDTLEEMTNYAPVSPGLDYKKAIEMLRSGSGGVTTHSGAR
jgi:hypothetical protein